MMTTSISDFRKDMKKYLDRVIDSFETLIINRGKDKGIVVMSLEEYNSLMTTMHLNSSSKNRERLEESKSQAAEGKVKYISPDDLKDE
jgi:antitoxin YefM